MNCYLFLDFKAITCIACPAATNLCEVTVKTILNGSLIKTITKCYEIVPTLTLLGSLNNTSPNPTPGLQYSWNITHVLPPNIFNLGLLGPPRHNNKNINNKNDIFHNIFHKVLKS